MKNIVYIHGFNCTDKIFSYLSNNLPAHNQIMVNYDTTRGINTVIDYILQNVPDEEEVSIIGHSLGGIIGYLLTARETNLKIDKLVSISTPFGGHYMAYFLQWFYPSWPIFADLCPRSNILKEIKETEITAPFLSIISTSGSLPLIYGRNDGVVTVDSQCAINSTERLELDTNHVEIIQDDKTVDAIRKFIF